MSKTRPLPEPRAAVRPSLKGRAGFSGIASVVAVDPFAPFVAFLRLDGKRRDGARVQALQRNRFAGLLAETIGAFLQTTKGRFDLENQLALAMPRAKLQLARGLRCGAVGKVGVGGRLGLQVLDGFAAF